MMIRNGQIQSTTARYLFSVLVAIAAFSITISLAMLKVTPYWLSYGGVVVVAILAGARPALLSAAISLALIEGWAWIALVEFGQPRPQIVFHPLKIVLYCFFSAMVATIAAFRDRSEKQLQTAESSREQSEQLARSVLESIGDGFVALDREWRFVYVNPAAEKITGLRADELLGNDYWKLFPLTLGTPVEREFRRASEGEIGEFEHYYEPWQQWFEARCFPRQGGGISVYFQDITERKRLDEELRLSNERFLIALKGSPISVFNYDRDLRFTWVYNPAPEFSAKHFIGKTDLEIMDVPEEAASMMGLKQQVLDTGVGVRTVIPVHVAGVLQYFDTLVEPLRNGAGEIEGLTCASVDITEQKRSEEALIRAEKLASVGRMAATVAHEINNPLSAVMNTLFLAREADSVESVNTFLDLADTELRRISHITRQALGFYREESKPESVVVGAILDEAVGLFSSRIRSRSVTIEKQYDRSTAIQAVAGEVRQIVSNLIANSLDAVGSQGKVTIRVSAQRTGVHLIVADNGVGIADAAKQRLFEPLFTTKGSIGTGLGLWVTKQLAEKHGGSVRVRSRVSGPRRGTSVVVSLPASHPIVVDNRRAAGSQSA